AGGADCFASPAGGALPEHGDGAPGTVAAFDLSPSERLGFCTAGIKDSARRKLYVGRLSFAGGGTVCAAAGGESTLLYLLWSGGKMSITGNSARRVALVTGGARGIGLGISRSLAADGFDLAVCGVRDAEAVESTLEDLRSLGGRVEYFRADVSQTEDRQRLIEGVRDVFGRLHVLVNNAGVAPNVRA